MASFEHPVRLRYRTVHLHAQGFLAATGREHLAETGTSVFDMQYGGSVVVAINHPLTDRIDWINSSRFFYNAFDRDHVSMDFMNRFSIKLWKYLQLRIESRAGYDPMMSYNIKFSQEFLLGVFYERRKP